MRKFIQTGKKVNWKNLEELIEKINHLGYSPEFELTVTPTIPDSTDTNNWSYISYWREDI